MGLLYLAVHATSDERPRVACIAYKWLESDSPLRIVHTGGEREILADFLAHTDFWRLKWRAIPVAVGLERQMGLLWDRSLAHGHLEFGASPWGRKPTLDLQHILCLINSDAPPMDGPSEVPALFVGARLDRFVRRQLNGTSVADLLKSGMANAAEKAAQDEYDAFAKLWGTLVKEAPRWWKDTLRPKVQT